MSVNRVETRFTGNNAEFMRAADAVDRKIDQIQGKVTMMDRALSTGFRAAGALGLAVTFNQVYDSLGRVIDRYNILHGLDQGALFFNSIKQSETLARGLGDVAIKAEAVSQTIRLMNAEAGLSMGNYQQLGQFSRGMLLTGETRNVQEGLHAAEIFITGGQSRMLHRLGIGVQTAKGYRDYARELGVSVMDLTHDEMLESRRRQFFANPAMQNTAAFGANADATKFQSLSAFTQNTKDSYVRSLAGAIEELAKSLKLMEGVDSDRLGRIMAVMSPLATGAMAATGARALIVNPMQSQAVQFSQLAAQQGILQSQLAQRGAIGAERLVAAEAAYMARQSAATAFTMVPGVGAQLAGSGLIVPPAVAGGLAASTLPPFAQTAAGIGMTAQLATLGAKEAAAADGYAKALERANAQQARIGAVAGTINAVTAVLAVGAAAWITYSNAVRGAEEAEKRIVEAGGSAGRLAAHIQPQMAQFQQGRISAPDMAAIAANNLGMGDVVRRDYEAWLSQNPGASPEQQRMQAIRAQAAWEAQQAAGAVRGGVVARSWLSGANSIFQPNAWIDRVNAEQDALIYQKYNQAVREGKKKFGIEDQLQQATERSDDLKKYDAFKDKYAKSDEDYDMQQRLLKQMGASGDLQDDAMTDHLRSQFRSILSFDYGELRGTERDQFLTRREEAMRGQISLDMADEKKRELEKRKAEIEAKDKEIQKVRENIETLGKENAARTQIAQMQDQALGANKRLLDTTNEEQSKRANASAVLSQYEQLLTRGNQELIKEFEAHHDVQGALKVLADASLDLTNKMRQAALQLVGGTPGNLSTQAGYLSAQIGAQGTLYGAMGAGNPYIEKSIGIYSGLAQLGPQAGDLVQQEQLLRQMQYWKTNSKLNASDLPQAIARNPEAIGLYLQSFRDLSPDAQLLAIAEQQRKVTGQRSSMATSIAGQVGSIAQFGASLQDLQNTPENRKKVEEFLRHGSVGATAQQAAYQLMFAEREGLLNSQTVGDFRRFLPGADWSAKGYEGWISGQTRDVGYMADKELQLITSMDDLRAAIDRNTGALTGESSFTRRIGLPPVSTALGVGSAPAGFIPDSATPEGVPASSYSGPPMIGDQTEGDVTSAPYGLSNPKYRKDVARRASLMNPGASCATCASIPLADAGQIPAPIGRTDVLAEKLKAQGWTVVPPDQARKSPYALMFTESRNSDPAPDHVYTMLDGQAWDKGKLYEPGKGRGGTTPDAYGLVPPTGGPVPVVVVNAAEVAGSRAAGTRTASMAAQARRGIIPVANQVVGTDTTVTGGVDMSTVEMAGWGGDMVPIGDPSGYGNYYQYPAGGAPGSQGFGQQYYYQYYGGGLGGGGG